jgi:hypothetical protein
MIPSDLCCLQLLAIKFSKLGSYMRPFGDGVDHIMGERRQPLRLAQHCRKFTQETAVSHFVLTGEETEKKLLSGSALTAAVEEPLSGPMLASAAEEPLSAPLPHWLQP